MTGVKIEVVAHGFDAIASRVERLGSFNRALVLDALGALGENQTKRRIAHEKTSPDGATWPANRTGTSILVRDGLLRDSIHHIVEGEHSVRWGSGLIYAAIHQVGGVIRPVNSRFLVFNGVDGLVFATQVTIPARPYLGVSAANAVQIERRLLTFIGTLL
jgi:phage gpG-like protein